MTRHGGTSLRITTLNAEMKRSTEVRRVFASSASQRLTLAPYSWKPVTANFKTGTLHPQALVSSLTQSVAFWIISAALAIWSFILMCAR